jgi:hypothetical protein
MRKNYFLAFFMVFAMMTSAQEIVTFSGYDGTGSTQATMTATINNEITLRFEDSDIINNFYTEN